MLKSLGVVVPAGAPEPQAYMAVSGGVTAVWMPAVHAGMTDATLRLPVEFVSWASTGESLFPSAVWEKRVLPVEQSYAPSALRNWMKDAS